MAVSLKYLLIFNYAAVYLVWGTTYWFIARAVETIPPLWLLAVRWTLGGAVFFLPFLYDGSVRALSLRQVASACLLGTLLILGGNGLVSAASTRVDSYLSALIVALVPLFVALFDFLLKREPLSLRKGGAVVLGVAGVALLLHNGGNAAFSLPPETLLVFGGLVLWSCGTSLGGSLPLPANPVLGTAIQMLFVGLVSMLLALVREGPPAVFLQRVSTGSLLALLFLAVAGSATFISYNWLLRHEPAFRVASNTLVNPLIAVFMGLVLGGEGVRPWLLPGMLLIFSGILLMLRGRR